MKIFFLILVFTCIFWRVEANAGWATWLRQAIENVSGKVGKVVDDASIPKRTPDETLNTKPGFDPPPDLNANSYILNNVPPNVARATAQCKAREQSVEGKKQCERKGGEITQCFTAETKAGSPNKQAERKCESLLSDVMLLDFSSVISGKSQRDIDSYYSLRISAVIGDGSAIKRLPQ